MQRGTCFLEGSDHGWPRSKEDGEEGYLWEESLFQLIMFPLVNAQLAHPARRWRVEMSRQCTFLHAGARFH